MITRTLTLIVTVALLCGTALAGAAADAVALPGSLEDASRASAGERRNTAHYRITIPQDDRRVANVEATFMPQDGTLYMFPGADHLPGRWSTFVSSIRIADENNEQVPLGATGDGSWHLASVPRGRVTLSYRVTLEHESHEWSSGVDGAAYLRDWGVFYTARSLIVANGQDREDITVEFDLPPQWQVTAPWERLGEKGHRFVVDDYELLSTSMFFAGTHRQVTVKEGSFELALALGGEQLAAQEQVFAEMAEGVFRYYSDLMGGPPRLQGRSGTTRSVVIINPSDATDGEAIGNSISILLEPGGDEMSQTIARLIFAHEFFHLWNGRSFAPDANDSEWFKEGFTNYYTLKALHRIGFLTDESFLGVLADFFYQQYAGDDGVGTLSMSDGDLKHDHWGLIYVGGMFVAIAQDLQIRTATSNRRSLDDLMRTMFDRYGETGYGLHDVERELGELAGQDQDEFFRRYVVGTERIPLADFLTLADIRTSQHDGRTTFSIPEASAGDASAIRRGLFGR